jgi:hypothetical protein
MHVSDNLIAVQAQTYLAYPLQPCQVKSQSKIKLHSINIRVIYYAAVVTSKRALVLLHFHLWDLDQTLVLYQTARAAFESKCRHMQDRICLWIVRL